MNYYTKFGTALTGSDEPVITNTSLFVKKSRDTMSGNLFMSNQRVLGLEVDYAPPRFDLTQAVILLTFENNG